MNGANVSSGANNDGSVEGRAHHGAGPSLLARRVRGWWGRLTVGPRYLASLDTETLLRRGLGEERARELIARESERRKHDGQALESFLQSATAHAGILGERHRDAVECHAIHGVLSEARSIDLDQRELLHPAPARVPRTSGPRASAGGCSSSCARLAMISRGCPPRTLQRCCPMSGWTWPPAPRAA
jgi:hypothetical protein